MSYTSHCEECPLKGKADVNCGRGPEDARFLVVVDSPSAKPETYNRLMPQSSLGMFSKHAQAEQFRKDDFFFYPQIRCAFNPDDYTTKEKTLIQKSCRPHLVEQIRRQRPEVVIPLGGEPSKQVHGRAVKITKIRGMPVPHDDFKKTVVLPMLNPLQVVLYPQHEPTFKSDFATLGRLVDNDYDISATGTVSTGDYEFIDDLEFLIREKPSILAFDTENTGLRWYAPDAATLTMQFCIEPGRAYLLPWDHPDQPQTGRAKARLKRQLRQLLQNPKTTVIGQNTKYDTVYTMAQTGIRFRIGGDTLMLATLMDENATTKNLDDLVKRFVPDMAGYADCVHPDTRLLLEDLTKKRAADIRPGDRLVGFEEFPTQGNSRRMVATEVESVRTLQMTSYVITMQSGERIQVSGNHQFLKGPRRDENGGSWVWRRASQLCVGDKLKLFPMPDPATSFQDGWMSGILDGEGYVTGHGLAGMRLGFCQKDGDVLREGIRLFNGGEGLSVSWDKRKSLANVTITGARAMSELIRLRPRRLIAKRPWQGKSLFVGETTQGRIASIEYVGLAPVVSIQTSSRTFIANGFATHNCFNATVDKAKMRDVPLDDKFLQYGAGDADAVFRLHDVLYDEVAKDKKLLAHYNHVTLPGLNAFASIELRGQYVSPDEADKFEAFMEQKVAEQRESLLRQVPKSIKRAHVEKGVKFSRAEFLRDILFHHKDGFKLKPKVFTKTTAKLDADRRVPSTSTKDHLPYFYDQCPFTFELAEHIKADRILNTNVKGFRKKYIVDDMVRPVYGMHVAVTGRTNSEDPNGQNVPKRGPTAMAYRKMFVAPEGYFLIENDLSQAELRIAADMANDPTMLNIYRNKGDIHTATALIVMGVTMEQFLKLPKQEQKDARTKAKAVNFGFLYGMSWRKFIAYAKTQYGAEFTEREAQRVRTAFFAKYSNLLPWHAKMREYAHLHKFVRSYSGRIRHLPMIDSSDDGIKAEAERQAINSPVQEFGSSLGVMALGRMEQEIDPQYLQIVGFVHDAIYAYVPKKYVEWGAKTLRWYMETNPLEEWFGRRMRCPIVADAGFGTSLGSIHEMGSFDIPEDGYVTVGDYDFDALFKDEKEPLYVPRQRIPPNNGRLLERLY